MLKQPSKIHRQVFRFENFTTKQAEIILKYMDENRRNLPEVTPGGMTYKNYLRRFPNHVGYINSSGRSGITTETQIAFHPASYSEMTWDSFCKLQLDKALAQ